MIQLGLQSVTHAIKIAGQFLGTGALLLGLTACVGQSSEPGIGNVTGTIAETDASTDGSSDPVASDLVITHPEDEANTAAVVDASFTGESGAYQVAVTVRSPDTGCEQYADWWEVISADGELLYRRILAHSHVEEQPFTRSGGPVAIAPTDLIFIRVHMNNSGYSPQILQGTVADRFRTTTLLIAPDIDAVLAAQEPQPSGCTF